MTLALVIGGIVLCVLLSAFFSASEMTFSSCNTVRLENARDDGDRRAAAAVKITEHFEDALGAILIGNNLVNIAASSLGSVLVILLVGDGYAWLSTLIITVLVIIFGETIPKISAKKNCNRFALRFAFPVRVLMLLLLPLIRLVVGLVRLCLIGVKEEAPEDAEEEAVEELQTIIETAEDEEVLDEDRSELVQAAIDFSEISAYEVMTARVDMLAIDIEDDWESILSIVEESPYSRLPVYEGSVDNVVGILYLNHFLKAMTTEDQPELRSLLMPAGYVYKTVKLPAVLNQMRRSRQHLAVVCDEYGGTLGLLSMEDVLEQIVGDIWDETDVIEEEVTERPGGIYELDGSMVIGDFLELMEMDEAGFVCESETVGGWTVECFQAFPKAGDTFERDGLKLTVLEMNEDGRRVAKVLVEKQPEAPKEE